MRYFSGVVPLFLPGVIIGIILAFAFAPALARRLRTRSSVAFLLLASLAVIVAATLTPLMGALEDGIESSGRCDLRRIGLASPSTYMALSEPLLNVILFVPLGLAVGLLPRSSAARKITIGALLLPLTVESIQMLVPALGRGCESADMFDNATGLLIGMVVGRLIGLVAVRVAP